MIMSNTRKSGARKAVTANDETERLRRVGQLLYEIEDEAMRILDGSRGASVLSILSRAVSARRELGDVLRQETLTGSVVEVVEAGYLRRIRTGIHEMRMSPSAAANLVGVTEEEMAELLRGSGGGLPLDLLERMANRLEAEQQLAMEPLV
jgi:hypothetical protein